MPRVARKGKHAKKALRGQWFGPLAAETALLLRCNMPAKPQTSALWRLVFHDIWVTGDASIRSSYPTNPRFWIAAPGQKDLIPHD